MPKKWRKTKQAEPKPHLDHIDRTAAKLDHVVVSANGNAPKRTFPKSQLTILLALAALLVLGVGGFAVWRATRPETKPKYAVTEEGVVLRKLSDEALQTEVQKLTFQKKFSSAQQLIKYQDKADSEAFQVMLATTFINQGKHQEALQVFLGMEKDKIGPPWRVARNIGERYEALQDKANALKYYQKALNLLKQAENVPVKDDEIHFIELNIKSAGG